MGSYRQLRVTFRPTFTISFLPAWLRQSAEGDTMFCRRCDAATAKSQEFCRTCGLPLCPVENGLTDQSHESETPGTSSRMPWQRILSWRLAGISAALLLKCTGAAESISFRLAGEIKVSPFMVALTVGIVLLLVDLLSASRKN